MSVSPVIARPLATPEVESVHELRSFVLAELRALDDADRLLMLVIPAPHLEPEALFRVIEPEHGVLWDPAHGDAFAGVGVAWQADLDGPQRFQALQDQAAELWPQLDVRAHVGAETARVTPKLYGGLAFATGAAAVEPWDEFGDGCFTLPRFGYGKQAEQSWLSLTVAGADLYESADAEAWAERLMQIYGALDQLARVEPREPRLTSSLRATTSQDQHALERLSVEDWVKQIEAIREAIHAGHFEKIVAARRTALELTEPPSASSVLKRLSKGLRASTRFAFCREQSTFLGATPERLIARDGRRIVTEALAGSIEVGDECAAQLLSSRKDLREHQLVVEAIVRRLEPLCDTFSVAEEPQIRELRDVLHLLTPIVGELKQDRHVLDLVEELHPTPAVGGVPTADAVRWIVEHESDPRGWYAAPIGWFDAHGDGEFAVALRSCVLQGRRAYLYAGAGIVGDSDPLLEYTETELKEQALLGSLESEV